MGRLFVSLMVSWASNTVRMVRDGGTLGLPRYRLDLLALGIICIVR